MIQMNASSISPDGSITILESTLSLDAKATARTISCVVPVYNSELTLATLVDKLSQSLPNLAAQWEIILVNDGSTDQSWRVICDLAQKYPELRGINLMRNYGQHNALLCGIRACSYGITVTLDDDLQNPIDEMEKLILKIDEGWDIVYGTSENRNHDWFRNLFSRLARLLWQKSLGINAMRLSSYRAFRTDIRQAFKDFINPSVAIDVLLLRSTQNVSHVFVRHDPRLVGKSNYNLRRLIDLASVITTGQSITPTGRHSYKVSNTVGPSVEAGARQ
jgi:glycosyltransferase involved in cell wall biosynthesis